MKLKKCQIGYMVIVLFGCLTLTIIISKYPRLNPKKFWFRGQSLEENNTWPTASYGPNKAELTKQYLNSLRLDRNEAMEDIDCEEIMRGNEESIKHAGVHLKQLYSKISTRRRKKLIYTDDEVASWANNCSSFINSQKYITSTLTLEEEEYPIAYSISIYKDLQSFENLLRGIYRPQNIYCVHVDQKSLAEFQTKVEKIIRCFDNVFLASKMTRVWYGHWTIVQATLNCMEDLVKHKVTHPWKYMINTCGQDYPIKTNLETVRALKKLNGSNSVPSRALDQNEEKYKRSLYVYKHPKNIENNHEYLVKTNLSKTPPPHGIHLYTGRDYFVLKREAVEFILSDSKIHDFFDWCKDTKIPDETVWATTQRMYPEFPGSTPPDKKFDTYTEATLSRVIRWQRNYTCGGQFLRRVCVYGSADLNMLIKKKPLLANKFSTNVDVFAMNCLAEWLRNNTIYQTLGIT